MLCAGGGGYRAIAQDIPATYPKHDGILEKNQGHGRKIYFDSRSPRLQSVFTSEQQHHGSSCGGAEVPTLWASWGDRERGEGERGKEGERGTEGGGEALVENKTQFSKAQP